MYLQIQRRCSKTRQPVYVALSAANVTIVGGLPNLGILVVAAPSTPDFSSLDAALSMFTLDAIVAPTDSTAWTTDLILGDHFLSVVELLRFAEDTYQHRPAPLHVHLVT